MQTARRAVVSLAILGLVIALVVVLQRCGDAPPAGLVDGELPPVDDTGTTQQLAPSAAPPTGPAPASASITGTEEETAILCAQTLDDVVEFLETERIAANPNEASELSEDQLARLAAEVENLPRSLAGSPDPELFLTAVLLDRPEFRVSEDQSAYATLLEFGSRAVDSGSPLLAWHALRACVEAEEYCPYPELEPSLLEAQQDNAEAWALAATLRYRRGDVAGALAAMQAAASASTSTWYWPETAAVVERSLAEQTAMPYAYRATSAFGAGAANLPRDSSLRMCREESAASLAWAEACLAFGTLLGELNETMMAQGLAYPLREQALTALGETERAAQVAEEYALFGARRATGAPVQQALLVTGPEQFDAWLRAIREFGETEGIRQFIRQELPPVLERAGLLEREGVRECAARLFAAPTAIGTRSATYRDYPIEEYPIQVGDQLQISVGGWGLLSALYRVGTNGTITMPLVADIAAVGKTTGQLEREIATRLSQRERGRFGEVHVILAASPSSEELRREFDNALREAAERPE